MHSINDALLPALGGAFCLGLAAAALFHWITLHMRRHDRHMREQGYRFIHALREYSAWIEEQRDLPYTARSLDELTSPVPLATALQIKRKHFPGLASHMVWLLQAHSRMIEYLWQQNLLRLSQGAAWRPAYEDSQYQQLRGAQEDLISEMVDLCRELMGENRLGWQQTGSDFSFSTGLGASFEPSQFEAAPRA